MPEWCPVRERGGLQPNNANQKREEGALAALEGGDSRCISSGMDRGQPPVAPERDSDCTQGEIVWKRRSYEDQESTITLFCCKTVVFKALGKDAEASG